MTEYWVSKQSYFCKYCDIYIRDDAPSRAQHENGLRHKGNLERYIRDIYKKDERAKKERADEASQVWKINEAARLAHQEKDLPDGALAPSSSKREAQEEAGEQERTEQDKRVKFTKDDWKGAENLQNYSDARSLGFDDADAEAEAAAAAEAEKELRSKEGRVGTWEAVVKFKPAQKDQTDPNNRTERLSSRLTGERDPDKKPIRKLFTERTLENDPEEALEGMEIKVKVDRRLQAQKSELDALGPALHGSLQPIRLDGTRDEPVRESPIPPPTLQNNIGGEEDVKPKAEELEPSLPAGSTIVFKKRKLKNSQPRQKP